MAGRNKQAESTQQQNAGLQQDIAKQNQALATENNKLRTEYQRPFIDFNQKIASGDRNTMLTAAAAPISNMAKQFAQTKSNIYDTVAPGAARDVALVQATRDQGDANAGYMNEAFMKSLSNLFGAGTETGQTALQQTGASLSAFQGSNSSTQNLINNATQRKASTMGAFGSLANLAGGGIFGMLSKGGGGGGSIGRAVGGSGGSGGSGYANAFSSSIFKPMELGS